MSRANRKKRKSKIIIIITAVFLVLFLGAGFFGYSKLGKLKTAKLDENSLGIDENGYKQSANEALKNASGKNSPDIEKDYSNILVMGIDVTKEVNNAFSADSILIATVDRYNKKLKLTSIMRDSLVNVDGVGDTKLKYAYSYGGPQLLVKTVNQSFNMNIKDYVKVDFSDVEKIVDYLGGVEINVKAEEIDLINGYQKGMANSGGKKYTTIKKSGLQTLNGKQAVAYSRIRYVGNYDYERTERQRRVISEILRKFSDKNPIELVSITDKLLPLVETNLGKGEILSLGSYIVTNKLTKPVQFRIPTDSTAHDYTNPKDGLYYMKWDKKPTIDALHDFIFIQ
ncbi:LCP family protein [Clostridium swellfunianum]|uniref:LCP family protein n=1 Tax=Clostridium swellfunianum TaxID=1367462 RepID=UPI00202E80A2|nr:LCP family protein [Clostridium swellfunianum]MCM0647268.1 LCP family protein [Clostridium swellfunianum]